MLAASQPCLHRAEPGGLACDVASRHPAPSTSVGVCLSSRLLSRVGLRAGGVPRLPFCLGSTEKTVRGIIIKPANPESLGFDDRDSVWI